MNESSQIIHILINSKPHNTLFAAKTHPQLNVDESLKGESSSNENDERSVISFL
jgi:hypothetical protein